MASGRLFKVDMHALIIGGDIQNRRKFPAVEWNPPKLGSLPAALCNPPDISALVFYAHGMGEAAWWIDESRLFQTGRCSSVLAIERHTASRYAKGRIAWLFQKYARMMMLAAAA